MGDGVGQDHDGGGGLLRGADGLQVHGPELVPGLDGIPDAHGEVEGLALQLHGVHAQVDEDLQAGVGLEPDGVPGAGHHGDLCIDRGDDDSVVGFDTETVADCLGGEDGVGDVGQVDDLPRHRGGDRDLAICCRLGHEGFLSERCAGSRVEENPRKWWAVLRGG